MDAIEMIEHVAQTLRDQLDDIPPRQPEPRIIEPPAFTDEVSAETRLLWGE